MNHNVRAWMSAGKVRPSMRLRDENGKVIWHAPSPPTSTVFSRAPGKDEG
jgi:hypothetical protein